MRKSLKPLRLTAAASSLLPSPRLRLPLRLAPMRSDVERDFLIGSWSDSTAGDCNAAVAFGGDGTFSTAEGDEGVWSLSGDALTLTGAAGSRTVTIIPIDRDTMEVVGEDGAHDRSTRCAGDLDTLNFDTPRIA